MAPTDTRQTKNAKNHEILGSLDSEGEKGSDHKQPDPFALSGSQLETVSLLVKSAVAAAVAQVLPLANSQTQNAMGMASPGFFRPA